ncbi:MAG: hypothetical protein M3355_10340 [Actinomycetota bacterium]|nr:hypothetical protein [Actinomycetota bacterium]
MRRALIYVIFCVSALAFAGCGEDGAEPDEPDEPPSETEAQTQTETEDETTPDPETDPSASPGLTLRAFLDSYAAGETREACALVTSSFENPRDRSEKAPESCESGGENDALAQSLEIVASEVDGSRAQVLALNVNRSQLLFELESSDEAWKVAEVESLGTLSKGDEPRIPGG